MPLNLKLSWKLALIGICSTVPLLCGTFYLINKYTNKDIRFAVLEQKGNRFLRPLDRLLVALPEHQALVLRSRAGVPADAMELSTKREQLDTTFKSLQVVTNALGAALQYSPDDPALQKRAGVPLSAMLRDWEQLKLGADHFSPEEVAVRHAALTADVRRLITYIGDRSNLILDPELDSFYLIDAMLVALPQAQGRLATIIESGAEVFRVPELVFGERLKLAGQALQLQESDVDRVTRDLQTALEVDPKNRGVSESLQRNLPPVLKPFVEATDSFVDLIKLLAETGHLSVPAEKFAMAGNNAQVLSLKLWEVTSQELDGLLQKRIDDLNRARRWGLGLVVLSLWLTIGVTGLVARSINRVEHEIRELNATLELRVAQRTKELEMVNKELESFSYSVSHDLRSPLRGIAGFTEALARNYRSQLDAAGGKYLDRVLAGTERMGHLIDDLLNLSRVGRADLVRRPVDLSAMARSVAENLQQCGASRAVEWVIGSGITMEGDSQLLRVVLENLLGNAAKFTSKKEGARIEFGVATGPDGRVTCFVRDNGAGFDMEYAGKLFDPFQRMHSMSEFPGTGIGLATVKRIIQRHGGQVWAEAKIDAGATIYLAL